MILTLDVGFANCGYAVICEDNVIACGVIATNKSSKKSTKTSEDYFTRSAYIATQLNRLIREYDITMVIGELPTGGAQSAKAMAMMNMATAIVASVVALNDLPAIWVTPIDVKKAVCGYRSASKEEVMHEVRKKFRGRGDRNFPLQKGKFEHIADAIGAYLAAKEKKLAN